MSAAPRKAGLRRRGALRGFTTIEAMISSVILLATVAGVTTAMRATTNAYRHQRMMSQAVAVADIAMEDLLLRYRGSDDLDVGSPHTVYYTEDGARTADTTQPYTVKWVVTDFTVDSVVLKNINLEVSWAEDNVRRSISVFTYRP